MQRYLAGTYEYRVQITEPNSDASASVNVTVAEVFDAEVGVIQVSNNREVGVESRGDYFCGEYGKCYWYI